MSRIGKQPIQIPGGVTLTIKDRVVTVKGPKGELFVPYSEKMGVTVDGSTLTVTPLVEEKKIGALWGLTRALINNAVVGVSAGWEKILDIYGVGYRAQLKGKDLDLQIGQSHPIIITPPAGVSFEAGQETVEGAALQVIRVKGFDKKLVGDVAAKIHALKPPEPYKGKGIRYRGEYVRRKAGKATG